MKKPSLNQIIVLPVFCILAIGFQSCNEQPKEKEQTVNEFDLASAKAEIEEKIFSQP